ncbi:hypothetical protein RN001_010373 [Aquatica leii]|uniref:Uncharacterized protein n=1 Tax=Aquatica leii TaxID=1421715 RepID=A0AAN7PWB4_9COLE|nr:hypothetical protein RN001_010373 [Aquatica leii]
MALLLTIVFCVFLRVGFSCNVSCNCSKNGTTLGYYWKEYFGDIPHDAVKGGTDKNGNPTYIGQVYSKEYELLPATIYYGCLTATASAYNKRLEFAKNIKILCSHDQSTVSWVATKNEETPLLTNCHLVVGGSEVGQTLNIGRVNHNGRTVFRVLLARFFGTIPNDALPGSLDEEGDVTFIGQVYIKEHELLSGTLYRGCSKIYTSAHAFVLTPDKNIKALCTNKPYKFKWKVTRVRELHKLTNCHLVIGGSEVGLTVYIGRTFYNGITLVGKVFQDDASNAGLWIPGNNQRIDDFEVLTYNC